jgi:menaquinone-dependent protoporphyrinogen IX oxidase
VSKALIVYGTRYGAAASTSEEIANVLRGEGLEVRVVNAKEEKVRDIADYELVVIGSGIMMDRWTSEPEDFLKKFHNELAKRKVALFVCCGSASATQTKEDGKPSPAERGRRKYLEEKAAKYHLQPDALGFFGGVYNYNKVPWWGKKGMEMDRPRVEATYKQTEPGLYDTRDWNGIRNWARDLAKKIHL